FFSSFPSPPFLSSPPPVPFFSAAFGGLTAGDSFGFVFLDCSCSLEVGRLSRAAVLAGGSVEGGASRSLLAITTPTRLTKEHDTTIPTLVSRVIVSLLSVLLS